MLFHEFESGADIRGTTRISFSSPRERKTGARTGAGGGGRPDDLENMILATCRVTLPADRPIRKTSEATFKLPMVGVRVLGGVIRFIFIPKGCKNHKSKIRTDPVERRRQEKDKPYLFHMTKKTKLASFGRSIEPEEGRSEREIPLSR